MKHNEVIVGIWSETGDIPAYKHEGDSGMDVKSTESDTVLPGRTRAFRTGLYFNIPRGYELQVRPRSGLAVNSSVTVLNSPGTVDSPYKGELGVIIHNNGILPFKVAAGDRIAQIVLQQVPEISWTVYTSKGEIETSSRGEGKFGSTGNK